MSAFTAHLFGASAALALFGGLHLEIASGQALPPELRDGDVRNAATTAIVQYDVNRAAKSDRHAIAFVPADKGEITAVSSYLSTPATTVAIRMKSPVKPPPVREGKQLIACEALVSALTEVAKQLQPGRCVT
jgi:hypothetical protein